MKSRCACVVALVVGVAYAPALAWHASGHMVVSLIAWREMSPVARKAVIDLLRTHPRIGKEEFRVPADVKPDQVDAWLFCQASTWPDLVRHELQKDDSDDARDRKRYDRPLWHYVDVPVYLSPQDEALLKEDVAALGINVASDLPPTTDDKSIRAMNVMQALLYSQQVFEGRRSGDKSVALCWVLHLTGDIHQPLHTTGLFTPGAFSPRKEKGHNHGDEGGNRILLEHGNLHAFWDGAPGKDPPLDVPIKFADVIADVDAIGADATRIADARRAAERMQITDWKDESYAIARRDVYGPLAAKLRAADDASKNVIRVTLEDAYVARARDIARQRIAVAALRLAKYFDSVFSPTTRPR